MGSGQGSGSAQPRQDLLPQLSDAQLAASDPTQHVWLSAATGTGKRLVLASRIWRLLLAGVAPDAILCLTRETAETAALSEKVIHRLAKWIHSSETDLAFDLSTLGEKNTVEARARARTLFARVLDSSFGGLRIETFEDFAQRLLARYPFEADLTPGFRRLDEEERTALSRRTLAELQARAERQQREELCGAIATLMHRLGQHSAKNFLRACASRADTFADLPAALRPWLYSILGVTDGAETDRAFADVLAGTLEIGREYAILHTQTKRDIAACDADELIGRAVSFLDNPNIGDWARFNLDEGTHHLLISSAQDTDWRHWRLVRSIADEFFAGEGAHEFARTLFVTGDAQAAIGSAEPIFFEAAFEHFDRLSRGFIENADVRTLRGIRGLEHSALRQSYRSAQALVDFTKAAMDGLPKPWTGLFRPMEQLIFGTAAPAQVILLAEHATGYLDRPMSAQITAHASRILNQVQTLLASSNLLTTTGRPARPQDIAILFKRGGTLAAEVSSILAEAGIPVIDEIGLSSSEPSAIAALIAAGRFALDDEDHEALALLLASPLLDSFGGAATRAGTTKPTGPIVAALRELVSLADETTPYGFFEAVLSGPLDGRRKLVSRLGETSLDQIETLISAALSFERSEIASLQAFLDSFEQRDAGLRSIPWSERSAVRLVSCEDVRDRKFPIVILADATDCRVAREPKFVIHRVEDSDLEIPLILPEAGETSGRLAQSFSTVAENARARDWRLFYVAIGSAREQLIITGLPMGDREDAPASNWYEASDRAFDILGVPAKRGTDRTFNGLSPPPYSQSTPGQPNQGNFRLRLDVPA